LEKELERLDAGSPTEDICLLTKQDISTLVGIGHFYCGLTCGQYSIDTQDRSSYTPIAKKQCLESFEKYPRFVIPA
jgi:hypothetical protein